MHHRVTATHRLFDNALATALTIEDGDTVEFECPSAFDWGPAATVADLPRLGGYPHILAGPVEIAGAEPGDALLVDILHVTLTNAQGIVAFGPTFGLLAAEVEKPFLKVIPYCNGRGVIAPGVSVSLDPFLGILGNAPAEPGEHRTTPPRAVGGNLDCRHLRPGTRVILPVAVAGAKFSCGDGHAAQGDGEVCGTAIEASVRATLRFSLDKGKAPAGPQAIIAGSLSRAEDEAGFFMTSGLGEDLYSCAQDAIRAMIAILVADYHLSWEDAYIVCSLAADLRIGEIVNRPTWMVSAYLPRSIFSRLPESGRQATVNRSR
jgi:acetamidase/formamidase